MREAGLRYNPAQCELAGFHCTQLRMVALRDLPAAANQSAHAVARKAGLFSLVFVMYAYTTAGPFGLEDQVTNSGPGLTLLYHLLIPFFWCIPVSLVAAELTTAIPVEGGFYRWVRSGFGDFWGFLAGWWNWCASFVLGGVYAVLFSDYLLFFFPSWTGWKHFAVSLALIVLIACQCAWNSDGWRSGYGVGDFHLAADRSDVRHRCYTMASQSVCAADSAACAE